MSGAIFTKFGRAPTTLRIFTGGGPPGAPGSASMWSAGRASKEDNLQGLQNNEQVQEHRPVLDVIKVVFQLLAGVVERGGIRIGDLRPAGNSGLEHVPVHVEGDLVLQLGHEDRPL